MSHRFFYHVPQYRLVLLVSYSPLLLYYLLLSPIASVLFLSCHPSLLVLSTSTHRVFVFSFEAFYFQISLIYYCNSDRIANVCILRLHLQFPSRCCSDSSFFTAADRMYGGSFLACIQASCFFGNRPFVFCPLYISLNFVTQGRTILNFLVFRVTNLRFSLHHRARRRYRASRLMVQ